MSDPLDQITELRLELARVKDQRDAFKAALSKDVLAVMSETVNAYEHSCEMDWKAMDEKYARLQRIARGLLKSCHQYAPGKVSLTLDAERLLGEPSPGELDQQPTSFKGPQGQTIMMPKGRSVEYVDPWTSRIDNLEAEHDALDKVIDKVSQRVDDLRDEMGERRIEIEHLEKVHYGLRDSIKAASLNARLEAIEARLGQLEPKKPAHPAKLELKGDIKYDGKLVTGQEYHLTIYPWGAEIRDTEGYIEATLNWKCPPGISDLKVIKYKAQLIGFDATGHESPMHLSFDNLKLLP